MPNHLPNYRLLSFIFKEIKYLILVSFCICLISNEFGFLMFICEIFMSHVCFSVGMFFFLWKVFILDTNLWLIMLFNIMSPSGKHWPHISGLKRFFFYLDGSPVWVLLGLPAPSSDLQTHAPFICWIFKHVFKHGSQSYGSSLLQPARREKEHTKSHLGSFMNLA